ncbi:ribonuclease H-like domain-containing protein [Tanacetum coccineum]
MSTHPMVTRVKADIFKPLELMNCHVTTTLPLPRSYVYALRDPNWKEAMLININLSSAPLSKRSLYGLKQAPRAWFQRFASYATRVGFQHTSSSAFLQRIITSLHSEFAMTDLGSLNYFLGISAQRSATGLFLSQSKFAEEILERAHMQNCNPCRTLLIQSPSLRILRYVRGTLDYGLQLHVSSTTQLTAYTDADWAGCPVTRRLPCLALGCCWNIKVLLMLVAELLGIRNLLYLMSECNGFGKHNSSGPALYEMTPATISLRLVPNLPPSTPFVPPSRTDWDILFQQLFDELLTPLPSVDLPAPEFIAPIGKVVALVLAVSTGSPSSKNVGTRCSITCKSQTNNQY